MTAFDIAEPQGVDQWVQVDLSDIGAIADAVDLAPYFAWAYAAVRPLKQVYIWGRNSDKAEATVDAIVSSSEYQSLPDERRFRVSA